MQYMLLFNEKADELGKRADPAQANAYWGGWSAYMGAIAQSGAMLSGNGLQPPETGTTLRIEHGSVREFLLSGGYAFSTPLTRKFPG